MAGSPACKRSRGESAAAGQGGPGDPEEPAEGVAMAVCSFGGRVGLAWVEGQTLFYLESPDDTAGPFRHQLLQLAKLHARPAVIYTSAKAEAELLDALRQPLLPGAASVERSTHQAGSSSGGANAAAQAEGPPPDGGFDVRTERSSLFHPRQARAVLEAVHLRGWPAGLGARERLHRLNAALSLSSEQQVCAAGALLAVLVREGRLALGGSGGWEARAADGAATGADSCVSGAAPTSGAAPIELLAIQEVSLDGYLLVDPASQAALQIFSPDAHPAAAMGIGGQPKEGFSVFGALNTCVSPGGRRLLRLWFSRPIVNLGVLNDRLDGVDFFRQRPDAVTALRSSLRKVKDAPRLLARLQGLQTLPDRRDFLALQASLEAMLLLRDMLVQLAPPGCEASLMAGQAAADGDWPGGTKAAQLATPTADAAAAAAAAASWGEVTPTSREEEHQHRQLTQLRQDGAADARAPSPALPGIFFKADAVIGDALVVCHNLIATVIDCSRQAAEDGVLIRQGVSEDLDDLREAYCSLPDYLTQLVEAELRRIPRELSHGVEQHLWSIVYMPQVGFLMRLEGGRLAAHLEEALPDYQFAFEGSASEDCRGVYYSCDLTTQLNERYGDLQHRMQDMEHSLACQVIARLAAFAPEVGRAAEAAAELDCILALAAAARELNLCRPQLTRSNELVIEGGRHLLTEQLVDTFIPNDTAMRAGRDRIQVVTGPNFSGKSCYAKQVALITFLAHVGSFVPAASARIGLCDRIFTRVASREAAALPQSAFMIDLTQVASMLHLGSERSLLIIDEFGKGTLAADGVGLLCATLRHLASLPAPPRVVLCTHFSEVLQPRFLPRSPQLSFLTMQVLVEGQQPPDPAQQQQQQQQQQRAGGSTVGALLADPQQQLAAAGRAAAQGERLVFLYRLAPGHAAPSFGVHCAQLAGVPAAVLERARHLIAAQARGAAITADPSGPHAQRSAAYRGLVQQLLQLNVHDRGLVQALLAAAAAATGAGESHGHVAWAGQGSEA
ncbi:hypothetical protein ABPG75_011011 [Micractinium tetrahymenae]